MKELVHERVEFMIVGLAAAALQGAPVVTQDIDLWFRELPDPGVEKALRLGKFDDERQHTIKVALGRTILVLNLERIIASKTATGREKDKLVLGVLSDALKAIRDRE